ncbi:MAG TPA: ATP-binding protein [Acidimicrobiales bacterium]|nr:ATP-binding protein [Acidimicrobiales bacterium]
MKAGLGARVAKGLAVPEVLSEGYERMLAVAQQLQAGVGAFALLAIWLIPGDVTRRDQLTVTALLIGVYLPWAVLTPRAARLTQSSAGRMLNLSVDLLAISSFALVIPSTRTAVMFAYVLVIAFHAYVSGRAAGLTMCVASLLLVLLAEYLAPANQRTDGFTLVLYGVDMAALALMVDALAVERRRTARHLHRLNRAIESVADDPTLSATTDSISQAARIAVGAVSVAVFLRPDDDSQGLRVAGHSDFPTDAEGALRIAVRDPESSPAGVAMQTGRPVAVADVEVDDRWILLREVFRQYEVRSLVSIPLGPPANAIGVLTAYFTTAGAFDDEDVRLLTAYARQASTIVARAFAFERERLAAAQLAQTDQLKSDFVSTVSHELRTPLTSICGFVDTVLLQWDRLDDEAKKQLLERASWNAKELRRLIEQVLAFSALDAASALPGLHPYRLRDGVEELVHHIAPAMQGCPVDLDIPEDLVVLANTETIHHALGNLLTNAAKFSPAGSLIRLEAEAAGAVARISVIDRGPGIAYEDQERIFERFYRGSTMSSARGTGIGLTIVRTSLEAIGGTVTVRSAPGEGATFEVVLPLADEGTSASAVLLAG